MSRAIIYIDTRITARVELPEDVVDDGEGNVTPEARTRAWEALVDFLPGNGHVYIDGDDEPPADVSVEPDCEDDAEFRAE